MGQEYQAYSCFAEVYDLFMDNVPYAEWAEAIVGILREQGIEDGLVLDLGCGTGKLTRIMAGYGYDMIGIDNSVEMLEIAGERGGNEQILYLLQDMREFELYGTVRAIYCACDSINYIMEEEELLAVFRLVNNYLDPGGIFIFDCNTPYKYETLLGENTFAENREEGSFIWENYYDPESRVNQYDLTLYIRTPEGLFRRFEETHLQRCYPEGRLRELLGEAGMEFAGAYSAYTKKPPGEDSERIMLVAREKGKRRK